MTTTELVRDITVPAKAAGSSGDRAPWPVVLLVAGLTAVVPVLGLLAVAGPSAAELPRWALAGPPLLGVGVLLSQFRVEAAVLVMGVAAAFLLPPIDAQFATTGIWPTVASMALFLGLCWVACTLGMRLPPRWSLLWLLALVGATAWGLGLDVPMGLLAVGWWVVGLTFRYRQHVADSLRVRADELAAEQDRYVAEAVRLERARIARELHDVVAHCMTVIVIQARAGQQLVAADPAAAAEALDAILGSVGEAEADIGTLVAVMTTDRPSQLSRELLTTLVDRASASGIRVRLTVRGDPGELPAAVAEVAHRAVQEALTNALRYASASDVAVDVCCASGLTLSIENSPGVAPALPDVGSGRGLAGLRDRVITLGGDAGWGSQPDGGWWVRVAVPAMQSVSQPAGPTDPLAVRRFSS